MKFSSAGISYLPISSKLRGETQKAGRQFDYHSVSHWLSVLFTAPSRTHWRRRLHTCCILAWAGEVGRGVQLCSLAAWCLGLCVDGAVSADSWSPWGTGFNQNFHLHGLREIFFSQITSVAVDQISRLSWAVSCPLCTSHMVSGGRPQCYRFLPVSETFS